MYKIKLEDKFFDSLRDDYNDFNGWFQKKQEAGAKAYITRNEKNKITSFLMLKIEGINEKYDDLDFIDVISEILDYVKRHNEITLHIKGQGIYTLVELYSENDFYDYDRCKIESDLIVKKKNIYKDGIYYMKFLLKGTDDDVRENL